MKKAFTTKRVSQKRDSDFSFANERREQTQSSGFTLIESMIAVTILTLSIAGPLFTANRAIVAAMVSRDQVTASYLAQEGIEYVRAMRDNEFLATYHAGGANISVAAWTDFLTGGSSASITGCRTTTCTLDLARSMGTGGGFSLQPCTGGACTPLYLANGIYTEQSGIAGAKQTPFTRTIQVVDIAGTSDSPTLYPDKRIVSTVSWSYHDIPYSVTVYDHITPWQ